MDPASQFRALLRRAEPVLALAPMQDITDASFWELLSAYDGADLYVTEYIRVYPGSRLNRRILRSVTRNPTGRPVLAQLMGSDIPSLVRTARELEQHPIAGIDFNLGCPAPIVYRKCAGGGLLRELATVDAILGALRAGITLPLTVKTRLGFESPAVFDALLPILAKHALDLVTVHGRTVIEGYRSKVRYDLIECAVRKLPCPVLANGNIHSATKADEVLRSTGAQGLMIGRAAIRSPWLFRQIRQHQRGETVFRPTGHDVLAYVRALHAATCRPGLKERAQVQRLKKFMNYLGLGVEPTGTFLHRIRRITTLAGLFGVCEQFLDHDRPMALEPFPLVLKETDVLAGEHG